MESMVDTGSEGVIVVSGSVAECVVGVGGGECCFVSLVYFVDFVLGFCGLGETVVGVGLFACVGDIVELIVAILVDDGLVQCVGKRTAKVVVLELVESASLFVVVLCSGAISEDVGCVMEAVVCCIEHICISKTELGQSAYCVVVLMKFCFGWIGDGVELVVGIITIADGLAVVSFFGGVAEHIVVEDGCGVMIVVYFGHSA